MYDGYIIVILLQSIMRANDLDCDGSLNFEEFLQAMPANTQAISEEEHR